MSKCRLLSFSVSSDRASYGFLDKVLKFLTSELETTTKKAPLTTGKQKSREVL